MKPNSRETLKAYCLRQLGYPVINIEVSEEQIEDCIDDAIQMFNERYYDGSEKVYLKRKIKKEEIDKSFKNNKIESSDGSTYEVQNNYIVLPDNIIHVSKVFTFGIYMINSYLNANYHIMMDLIYNLQFDGLVTYTMTREYMSLLQFLTSGNVVPSRYHRINNKLYIDINWNSYGNEAYIVVECYAITEPNAERYWNDIFLKKYATLLIKRQWGANLIKYENVQLPGGITLNGSKIYDEANQEIKELFEDMSNTWQIPPLDRIG